MAAAMMPEEKRSSSKENLEGIERKEFDVVNYLESDRTSYSNYLRHRRQQHRSLEEEVGEEKEVPPPPLDHGTDEVLVIAPWFLAPSDGTPSSSLPFLKWVDRAAVSHTFRYGAESIPSLPVLDNNEEEEGDDIDTAMSSATISSYGAMDVLLETLCDRVHYPNLQHIVVVGHSAGGQFVHRWGLSSNSSCFGDNTHDNSNNNGAKTEEDNDGNVDNDDDDDDATLPSVRLVAANPRSYAYLDERRYLPKHAANGGATMDVRSEEEESNTLSPFEEMEYRPPTTSEKHDCQAYNRYCWGLEDNPDLPAPYVTGNIDRLLSTDPRRGGDEDGDDRDDGNNLDAKNADDVLFLRYASRDVVYLSGERDTKTLGNQLCDEDGYQGPSRRERSERFYASLQVLGEEALESCRSHREDDDDDAMVGKVEDLVVGEGNQSKGGFCARQGEDGATQIHERIVVKDVGHDHALIFQSAEGQEGMFSY
mmetsp:Transcript_32356/g.59343  ORF Transcript_32356/g.59343 Transcript_32356/m.59343 type:complete len:479 (+) Transcript_32356:1852-3288(+)